MTISFFYCYDKHLRNHLHDLGFRHNCAGLHLKTHKEFWQFTQSDELRQSIRTYTKSKQIPRGTRDFGIRDMIHKR